ncbi:hypothetical protein GGR52DRAFT_523306 [Hypoxylon sp. FL1284]|nr:hypothetical protein GGR52DRAFT_523306 [Hypoxylon sp. FL1284]
MGLQVRKAWFATAAGREWRAAHCPGGNPPPLRPGLRHDRLPPPAAEYPRWAFHWNFRFDRYRFVACP